MENAAKALIIAGGGLLLVLVLTLAMFIFKRMATQSSSFYREMSDTERFEYNQKFFNYESENLRIQDVVTLINLAKDANEKQRAPVTIKVSFGEDEDILDNFDVNSFLSQEILASDDNNKKKYKCNVEYAGDSGYVGTITIDENTT